MILFQFIKYNMCALHIYFIYHTSALHARVSGRVNEEVINLGHQLIDAEIICCHEPTREGCRRLLSLSVRGSLGAITPASEPSPRCSNQDQDERDCRQSSEGSVDEQLVVKQLRRRW